MTSLEWQVTGGCSGMVLGLIILFVFWRLRDGYWWP
jgi:hypothetical protein